METEPLGDTLQTITALLGVFWISVLAYLVLMGAARRVGKTSWFEWEVNRRKLAGKPNITLLSKSNKTEFPWNDPSLIAGGFTALISVAVLALFVPVDLFILYNTGAQFPVIRNTGALMIFPIGMLTLMIFSEVGSYIRQYTLPKQSFLALRIFNGTCALLAFSIALLRRLDIITSDQLVLYLQLGFLLIVSCSLSYTYGISDGLKDADIEARFPLVEVITNTGNTLKRLRLYEKTDNDYRFISESGVDNIIPSAVVQEIRHMAEEGNKKTTSGSSKPVKPEKKKRLSLSAVRPK